MNERELQRAHRWIVNRDTGLSSVTIWSVMMGVKCDSPHVPADPDDFGRCWRLLVLMPWRSRLPEVAALYQEWTGLVREWDRLSKLYEACIATDEWDREASKKLFDAMQPLIYEGRLAAGWEQTGPGCWKREKQSRVRIGQVEIGT